MEPKQVFLVVGADGMIGRALANRLEGEGHRVLRTTLLPEPGAEVLDLGGDPGSWNVPRSVQAAFLLAAATSLEYCRTHPAQSRAVNVDGTLALARLLAAQGARVVFSSTNLIFDGLSAFQQANAPPCPQTEYGRQKALAEQGLAELPGAAIVRFSKVIGPASPLLMQWAGALRKGAVIRPFSDMSMAPTPVTFAAEVLARAARSGLEGVVQASAAQDVTYEEAARHIARQISAPQTLIEPITVAESGLRPEHVPANTTLDTTRLRSELGLAPPDAWAAIEMGMNS